MSETTYPIVPVATSDLEALRAISAQTFTETFAAYNTPEDMKRYTSENLSPERLAAELNTKGSRFYFVLSEGTPAGYLKLNLGEAQTVSGKPQSLEIERIYVLQAFQGQRLGKLLLEKAIVEARSLQLRLVWLGVWEQNRKAIGFYTRYGFVQTGSHVFLLGNDAQTDYIMELVLSEAHAC